METANEILKQVVPILMIPVNKYLRYLILCTTYIRDMGLKMTELNAARDGVEERIKGNIHEHLEVPAQVNGWLEAVEKINEKVKTVPSDPRSCFNMKIRHSAGKNAFHIIKEIDSLMNRQTSIIWNNHPIHLGRVDSMKASTSTPLTEHEDFPSRKVTFTEAFKALGPTNKSCMVALWGMGGVGKSTMMKKLKDVVEQKKMFKYIIPVVIGGKTDPISIQKVVDSYLGKDLKDDEENKSVRADKLRQRFKAESDEGKNKFLIILDDVWHSVDLEDIGLSPLPNQGVDFKVLLTSRDRRVCIDMGVEDDSIFEVQRLTETEAQNLFHQISKTSDPELHKIGEYIVRKLGRLPIAIKTMACTLKGERKDAWNNALSCLEYHNVDDVSKVFKVSYDNLQGEETKSIFLLCGLYPEDFDIPTEELVRYGWGLKLFKKVYTISEARNRLNTCIGRLIHTNLLMESDKVGCIKMHDLVLAFVLGMFSKVEHASIVNHGSISGWPENDHENDINYSSCKRMSLTCKGMSGFPTDLKFPNLSILKLMHGDKSLRFPQDFYGEMEKLQVISYGQIIYPLLPTSPSCSINLRVLHLNECSLMLFDCSSIGNLKNLEVLNFANSGIEWLPSTIGNLKKLRLLDLTDCAIHIDNGVLRNLIKLEELYMRVGGEDQKSISLTDENFNEMAERSKSLFALEFQFFENNAQPKNMSFGNLQRFKISVGRYLDDNFSMRKHSSENALQLDTDKAELLESRINELFEKTEVLCLSVRDMDYLEDLEARYSHPPHTSSFYNLRVLVVSRCTQLKYLFTLGVANTLSKLEHLEVLSCYNIEELIHIGGNREETITFPKLKFLSLSWLEKLSGLCHNVNVIELPQLVELKLESIRGFTGIYGENKLGSSCLLTKQVVNPKLEKLHIDGMASLKEIWPYEFSRSEEVNLREIKVKNCHGLVNMFPRNPMSMLNHLEELKVKECGSIEVLFNIDLDFVGENGEESISSCLRSIKVQYSENLREVWRIKCVDSSRLCICSFQAVESIWIWGCKRFRNVYTPITTNFDLGSLIKITISDCGEQGRNKESAESSQEKQQINIQSKDEMSQDTDSISNIVFPASLVHSVHNLRKLYLDRYKGVEVVFEIESPKSRDFVTTHGNQKLLTNLEELDLGYMDSMSHVWKCNWSKFLILQKQQSESPFHNLKTISVNGCKRIKYLFSPLMAKLLFNLVEVKISRCDGLEEVVSNRDDEDEETTTFTSSHTSTTLFPRLDSLKLEHHPNLKCIGGARGSAGDGNNEIYFNNTTTINASDDKFKFSHVGGFSWTLCQYAREIDISFCDTLSSAIPCYAAGKMQKLQNLSILSCKGMKEVFETQLELNNSNSGYDEGNGGIPRPNNVILLPNLKILYISYCGLLEHTFTFSAIQSLIHLERLIIFKCDSMKVVVKQEEEDDGEKQTTTNLKGESSKEVVVFPRLKSIKLEDLPEMEGFFLGKNHEFWWPSLEEVTIKKCPKMRVFTTGESTAPQLKYMHTSLGKHSLESGLNFHVITAAHQQTPLPSSSPAASEGMPWSFHNLIKIDMDFNDDVEKVIPSSELLQLQKLEKIHVCSCHKVEEVFEALEAAGTNDETQTTLVKLPNLKKMKLEYLRGLRYIWKSNQRTAYEFPNLTRISINECKSLEHVFTSSMVGSLLQLQELYISHCNHMEKVIVKDANVVVQAQEEDRSDGKMKEMILPCLKSLIFEDIPYLKGFFLEKVDFSLPLLDTLIIKKCPEITIFTKGNLATPELEEIETNFGSLYAAKKDINSIIEIKQEEFRRDRRRSSRWTEIEY